MPPRKSAASTASVAAHSPNGAGDVSMLSTATAMTSEPKSPSAHKSNRQSGAGDPEGERSEKHKSKHDDIGIDDLLLPRTLTSRLSRGTLPPNTSIQRDALLALTKSATVFISYLGHTANSLTSRKTIQSQDILEALRETELWNVPITSPNGSGKAGAMTLGERVQAEVEKWEGEVRGKRKGYRERVKARESGGGGGGGGGGSAGAPAAEDEAESRGPIAKKARKSTNTEDDATMDIDGNSPSHSTSQKPHRNGSAPGNEDTAETEPESEGDAEDDNDEEQDQADEDEEEEEDPEDEGDAEPEGENSRLGIDDQTSDQDENDDDDDDDDDDDAATRRRTRTALAPNGRVEVGSDEDSD